MQLLLIITGLAALSSCNPLYWRVAEDVIEGEAGTAAKVASDLARTPNAEEVPYPYTRPKVELVQTQAKETH